MLKKPFLSLGLMAALAFSLTACFSEEAEKEDDAKSEQVMEEKQDDDKENAATYHEGQNVTPGQAVENIKQDAKKVGDKAVEIYNKAKDEATKAMNE